MKIIIKLAISQLRLHWIRTLLTSAAIIISVSLIVVMIGGFAVTLSRATDIAKESFGRYDLAIALQGSRSGPGGGRNRPLPQGDRSSPQGGRRTVFDLPFIESLRSDPLVASISPVSETRVSPSNPNVEIRRFASTQLVGTDDQQPPSEMADGKWLDLNDSDSMNVVIDGGMARDLKLKVGDDIGIRLGSGFDREGAIKLKVIGVTSHSTSASGMGGIYVPFDLYRKLSGRPPQISRIFVELNKNAEIADFKAKWQERVAGLGPSAQIMTPESIEQSVAQSMERDRIGRFSVMRYVSGGIAILASVFIIFTALSIGVRERIRQLAILRAVGMTRSKVSLTIIFEALMFALIGWLGGLLAGWLALHWTMRLPGEFLTSNVPLELRTVLIAAICAFGATLLASLIPVIASTRSKPLDAITPVTIPKQKKLPWVTMIVGLALIAFAILITTGKTTTGKIFLLRYFHMDMLTFPIMIAGFILIAPLVVIVVEKIFAPILGWILGLDRRLLSQQLSSNLWRTVGVTIALTICLGLYVMLQTWGSSMLIPFMLPDKAPDMVATFVPDGLSFSQVEQIKEIDGVKPDRVLPMIVEQPKLSKNLASLPELKDFWMGAADNVMLFGCDVEKAIVGEESMLDAKFIRGDKHEAIRKVKEGGHCITTDQLYIRAPEYFSVGKTITVDTSEGEIGYTIAGIVEIHGWQLLSEQANMRKESTTTAAALFAPFGHVAGDLNIDHPRVVMMNVEDDADRDSIKAKMQDISRINAPQASAEFSAEVIASRFRARVLDTNEMHQTIMDRAGRTIWTLTKYPLYALVIASLGVFNAIMASIRARRWEMGVLRGIGLIRGQLFRLVLAEAALIGIVACVLSFAFGVTEAWAGTVITGYRFGVSSSFVIPWGMLGMGFLIALGLCLLAAIWPAWAITRREPLQLLQEGRASM